MASKTEPNSQIEHGWAEGDGGWAADMNNNLLRIGRVGFHLSVIDRNITDPSTLTPSDGDRYIVAASAVGDWAGQDGNVAVYDSASTAWVFYTPSIGWVAYIEDEEVLSAYKAGGWSAGIAI